MGNKIWCKRCKILFSDTTSSVPSCPYCGYVGTFMGEPDYPKPNPWDHSTEEKPPQTKVKSVDVDRIIETMERCTRSIINVLFSPAFTKTTTLSGREKAERQKRILKEFGLDPTNDEGTDEEQIDE